MDLKDQLRHAFVIAEKKARSTRLNRLIRNPLKYPILLAFDKFLYPVFKKGINVSAKTFFGQRMNTVLPSGTDIMLNGIKSHDSEIRLSGFLLNTLQPGDCFIDIGAHYGYYSLLASVLVGREGKVISIEPTTASYTLLKDNLKDQPNSILIQAAVGEVKQKIKLYEYPGPYAEYNTVIPDAYADKAWAKNISPLITQVETVIMDELLSSYHLSTAVIKIDVEGNEPGVVKGMQTFLKEKNPVIAMEYLLTTGSHSPHRESAGILEAAGLKSFSIQQNGSLKAEHNIEEYMRVNNMDSDNIVFKK